MSYYSALSGLPAVSDNKGNTYIQAPTHEYENAHRFVYVLNPTVGSGHTVTVARTNSADIYPAIVIYLFSGVASHDQDGGTTSFPSDVTTVAPGLLTPVGAGALCITGMAINKADTPTVTGGLTKSDVPQSLGVCIVNSSAYIIQTSIAAFNPTWNWSTADKAATSSIIFAKAAGGAKGAKGGGKGNKGGGGVHILSPEGAILINIGNPGLDM